MVLDGDKVFYVSRNASRGQNIALMNGKVGVGTTSPDSTLHVNGNASSTISFTRYYQLNVNSTSVSTYSSGLTQSFGIAFHVDGRSLFSSTFYGK